MLRQTRPNGAGEREPRLLRTATTVAIVALVIAMAALAARADSNRSNGDQPKQASDSNIAARTVADGMARTDANLNELLEKVPQASAKEKIRRAIELNRSGHEKALEALNSSGPKNVRARVALKASNEDSQRALKDAIDKTEGTTRATIRWSLDQLRAENQHTLAILDEMSFGQPNRRRLGNSEFSVMEANLNILRR
jgi:hypothetical protein